MIAKLRTIICLILVFFCIAQVEAQSRRKKKDITAVIREAKTYIGTPYVYGGLSKRGIDCSGLIYNCYRTIDVDLPRTAEAQAKIGKSQSWKSVRPGDIVYFKFKEKGEKWWHSGMITEVDGDKITFIHASTSRGVTESNLNSNYYAKNVKKFRRVI